MNDYQYISEKNSDRETLLHRACYLGNLKVVKFLVENFGRDISIDVKPKLQTNVHLYILLVLKIN